MSALLTTPQRTTAPARHGRPGPRPLSWHQFVAALPAAARKLHPRDQWRNPVMFLVWVGAALTTGYAVVGAVTGAPTAATIPRPPPRPWWTWPPRN